VCIVEVPPRLLEEARRRGIDPVDLLAKALSLDPGNRAEAHLELAEKFLSEGVRLAAEDPVQASEKLYKAAEEAVKAIAIKLKLRVVEEVDARGSWVAADLFNAVTEISKKYGEEARLWWRAAWFLHVEGFHEARLSSEEVSLDIKYVKALVELAGNIVRSR